jgi:menaquinone-dependent protoporphyrinogen oxidase
MARILIAQASKRGGTEGIADMIAERLEERGVEAVVVPAGKARRFDHADAVVVGSALYGGRWQRGAVRAVKRLARLSTPPPVWLFHSGPLGDEDADEPQRPPRKVEELADRLDADVVTFGGRLSEDADGFIAKAMVRNGKSGDWRDAEMIRGYADAIADALVGGEAA